MTYYHLIGIPLIILGIVCIPFSFEQKKVLIEEPIEIPHLEPQTIQTYEWRFKNIWCFVLGIYFICCGLTLVFTEYIKRKGVKSE